MKTLLVLAASLTALTVISASGDPQSPPPTPPQPQQNAVPAPPQTIPNERIDYDAFLRTAREVKGLRDTRRITEDAFLSMAAEQGTVVLDARSADKYLLRHIKGAVSLPFTDFTEESLAGVIPDKNTRVLIYCNNNFNGSPAAFKDKRAPAALNISTYVSLATYGYTNVWELGPLLNVADTKIVFEGTETAK